MTTDDTAEAGGAEDGNEGTDTPVRESRGRMVVSFLPAPSDRFASDDAARTAVVGTGDRGPGAADQAGPAPDTVRWVDDRGSLSLVGLAVDDVLSEWAAADVVPTVHVEGLHQAVESASAEQVFRFAHVLTHRVGRLDGTVVGHAGSHALDEWIVATLAEAFERDGTGELCRTRPADADRERVGG